MKLLILNPNSFKFNPRFSQLSDHLVNKSNVNYCVIDEYINKILLYKR
jgi:hypothetical protein